MPENPRNPHNCPHRRIQPPHGAQCALVQQIVGPIPEHLLAVDESICHACCASFPPSPIDPNPVVASLVYTLSSTIDRHEGVPGCDQKAARQLRSWAIHHLPDQRDALPDPTPTAPPNRPIEAILPPPIRRSGPSVRRWAVGVTTSHRAVPTLANCLQTLDAAGWPQPRLFVDGDTELPAEARHLPLTVRHPRIGAWPSYYLALAELLMREPAADAYLLLQDDAQLLPHPGLRSYLERLLWPGHEPGLVSLFCSRAYEQPGNGWHRFHGHWVWCALAFIFSRTAAQRFLADREVVLHRWNPLRDPLTGIDWRIGEWAAAQNIPIHYPCPSLVQHIGHTSTLWPGQRILGFRRASRFAGDEL